MVILGQETLTKYKFFKNEKADVVMFMNLVKGYLEINAKGIRCKIKRKVETFS